MQTVRAVVDRELVAPAVQREATLGNAIGITADRGAEIARTRQIAFEIGVAENDVVKLSGSIRHQDRLECGAQREYPYLKLVAIGQGDDRDGSAIGHGAEIFLPC